MPTVLAVPERLPADEAERVAIRSRTKETFFVEAGAGTGKTRELVQRIVRLVAAGIALPSIAAITFTNAAASELRERVRLELVRATRGQSSDYDDFDQEQRRLCDLAADAIDLASIQTLHSFAQRILSLYPIEAGLPPELVLRDEVSASIAFEERWQRFLESLLEDGNGDSKVANALVRGLISGLTVIQLRVIAKNFHENWDRVQSADFECPEMPALTTAAILSGLEMALALRGEIKPSQESDRGFQALISLEGPYEDLRAAQETLAAAQTPEEVPAAEEQLIWLLAAPQKLAVSGTEGSKTAWHGGALAAIRAASKSAEKARDDLLSRLRAACLGPLLTAIQRFVLEYRDQRVAQGNLEYHDRLILARNLLAGNAAVRGELAERYHTLLIDEFQDTDPIQIEIAVLIASEDPEAGQKPWHEVTVAPGRLFFVGDAKQSIYRFRRADIELYDSAARRFGGSSTGHAAHLVQNFRSVPSVLDWVNHTLGSLLQLERKKVSAEAAKQVEFEALKAWRTGDERSPVAVQLLGGPLRSTEFNAETMRALEASSIARLVAQIKDEGESLGLWRIRPDAEKDWRQPRFSDIAILMPTRAVLSDLEKALQENGIPFQIESRSLLFESQEVRDLLNILAAIDDPTDQVAVVAALRSPGFGCSDRDLFRFATAGGSWDFRRAMPDGYPDDDIVGQSMAALKDLNAERWWVNPAEMVDRVIRERRLFQVALANRQPRESWQRLRFMHEQARAFGSGGGRSLRQFVQFMERQAEEQAQVSESSVAEADADAVRIMTIHAAKGLEFPIVFLAGLNARPNNESPAVLWHGGDSAEVRVGAKSRYFETGGYESAKSREDAMQRLETDRLLYVAATRARDHLVASVFHIQAKNSKSHAERHLKNQCVPAECLYAISNQEPGLWKQAVVAEKSAPPPAAPAVATTDSSSDRDAWQEERRRLIATKARMPVLAATAIAKSLPPMPEERGLDKEEQTEDDGPWRRGRAGTSIGRAVHAVLQSIDLATGEGTEDTAKAQATAEGIEGRQNEVVEFVEAARQSKAVKEAVESGRFWREVYVSALVEGVTIEGFIDLLYEGPDGLVVVDYKTDSLASSAAIDTAMAQYRLQGATYALLLQESLGRPVSRCVFAFVQPRQERAITDLPAAIDEVRQTARASVLTTAEE